MRSTSGFTLIEVILVTALAGLFLLVAFVGQRQIRDHAQFDGAVEKLVTSINDARNQATSGVNVVGTGDGRQTCGGPGQYVFAGIAWSIDDTSGSAVVKFDYYEAGKIDQASGLLAAGAVACTFDRERVNLGSSDVNITGTVVPPWGSHGGKLLFVRNNAGGLLECPFNLADPSPVFELSAACNSASQSFVLTDSRGDTATVNVDGSGLATRKP